jgi:hypothetical protein
LSKLKKVANKAVSTVVTVVDTVKNAIKDGAKIANKLSSSITDITSDVKKWTNSDATGYLNTVADVVKSLTAVNQAIGERCLMVG